MGIVLGFTPYIAFFVVMRVGTVEVAMWAAFAMAALIFLYERRRVARQKSSRSAASHYSVRLRYSLRLPIGIGL
ncbi:MAG: hypothetical protein WA633_24145 [Stellaceae bacterium]